MKKRILKQSRSRADVEAKEVKKVVLVGRKRKMVCCCTGEMVFWDLGGNG